MKCAAVYSERTRRGCRKELGHEPPCDARLAPLAATWEELDDDAEAEMARQERSDDESREEP